MKEKIINTKLAKEQIGLFYLGQEGFIIKYEDKYILTDGYLSDYVDRNCCSEKVKWVRKYSVPINPNELDFIDYVFCSHSHYDHTDPDTISAIAKVNEKAVFILPKPIVNLAKQYGVNPQKIIGAKDLKTLTFGNINVTPIAAAHEQLHTDENGDYMELGYKFELGDISVFHAGDCCIYNGLAEKIGKTDVALLPINGRDYYRLSRNIIGNMDSSEAVELCCEIKAKLLVPMHFDLYDVNMVSPSYFVECVENGNYCGGYHIFRPGEKLIYAN